MGKPLEMGSPLQERPASRSVDLSSDMTMLPAKPVNAKSSDTLVGGASSSKAAVRTTSIVSGAASATPSRIPRATLISLEVDDFRSYLQMRFCFKGENAPKDFDSKRAISIVGGNATG